MKKQVPFVGDEFLSRDRDKERGNKPAKAAAPAEATQSRRKEPARIDWRPVNNGHAIRVNVRGDMTIDMVGQWRKLMRETAGNGINQFEFDLRDTPSVSIAGLAMLLLFKDDKRSGSRDISLNQCSPALYRRLSWCGLTKEFIVRPRRDL